MKKIFYLIFVPFIIGLIAVPSKAEPVKKVLIEQHTGAWCGWCVDGTVVMDNILAKYGDRVIGVKLHNQDKMAHSEQGEIALGLGLTGYPGATIDRKHFNKVIAQNRGNWMSCVESALNEKPKVDISMKYKFTQDNTIEFTVRAEVLEDIPHDIRFSLYVIEDSVSGSGQGWDQSNYLNNSAGHPYYGKGNPIPNYQHMKVVRKYLAKPFGDITHSKIPAKKGDIIIKTFRTSVESVWKTRHLTFVGFAQIYTADMREVLNCCYGEEGETMPASIEISSSGSDYSSADISSKWEKSYNIGNFSGQDKTFIVNYFSSDRTPSDWTIDGSIPEGEFTVKNGNIASFKIGITPGSTGIGDAKFAVWEKDAPWNSGGGYISCFSRDIQGFEIIEIPGQKHYAISQLAPENKVFQITQAEFVNQSSNFNNKSLIIWNAGERTTLTTASIAQLTGLFDKKVNFLLCGGKVVSDLLAAKGLSRYGVTLLGYNREGFGSSPYAVTLSGIEGDPITAELGSNIPGNLLGYLLPVFQIDDPTVTPILRFANDSRYVNINNNKDTVNVEASKTAFSVKGENNGHKWVFLGFCPYVIKDDLTISQLSQNAIKWLLSPTEVEEEKNKANEFSIYPNPANDIAIINAINTMQMPLYAEIGLYDYSGIRIDNIFTGMLSSGDNSITINTSQYSNGFYFVRYEIGAESVSIPLIIAR